ncbi:MAG: ABC transporter ATP-binding protein [Actinomycetota bacterium]
MNHPRDADDDVVVDCDQLLKVYPLDGQDVIALQGLRLTIRRGERVGIIGASGSGKSTLLNILGALDEPTAGRVSVAGVDLTNARPADRNRFRRSTVGFVWQQGSRNLVHHLSALDNVALPRRAARLDDPEGRARDLLDLVGLADRGSHRPAELSGGEQQRVAIAVALANEPALVLADEPTGELDSATSLEIYELLRRVTATTGLTQVIVSHDRELARHVDRVVTVREGRISAEHRSLDDQSGGIEEFLAVDRFGQLQLGEQHPDVLGTDGLVTATVDGDEIRLRRADRERR